MNPYYLVSSQLPSPVERACSQAIVLGRLIMLLAVSALILSCTSQPQPESLTIDLGRNLPSQWQPIDNLLPINIDADAEDEYLLFYTYDPSQALTGVAVPGPVGAVIFDPQATLQQPERGVENATSPTPGIQAYRLLPSYWRGAGHGFIAPPTEENLTTFLTVQRIKVDEKVDGYSGRAEPPIQDNGGGESVAEDDRPSSAVRADELVVMGGKGIFGGATHISVFWWSNPRQGYGSTQISAPGGLYIAENGWGGKAEEKPIRRLQALYPQDDRSGLCKESIFERRLDPDHSTPDAFRPAVFYVEGPRTLNFCYGSPESPFYPEAVVIAYLLDPSGRAELVRDELRGLLRRQLADFLWVDSIQYLATVDPYASTPADGGGPSGITTTVWATLIYSSAERPQERLYAFTLAHVPSSVSQRTTDRWLIVDAQRQ